MDSQKQTSCTAPDSRAMYALVAKTAPGDESLWLPLTYHLLDTAAVMDYLLENWLPEHSCESLELEQEDFRRLAFAAALLHDTGKATKLFQCNITAQRPELRERLRDFGLEDGNFLTLKNLPHAAAGAELLRLEGFNESLAAVVGAHHGKPETCYGGEEYYFSESNPLSFGWLSRGGRATGWGAVQNEIIHWALSQDGMETPENLPECSMAAQMLLTALVIMADWIASNTAYFPLISTEELPQSYDTRRAEIALKKLRLPEPWRISEDWQSSDYFERRFGFSANRVQESVEQIAANMETPGMLILEAPMGQGKTEAALAAAEILMNRFRLGGAAFFLPSQATSNAMFSRMTLWARRQPDAVRVAVELAHGQSELNGQFLSLEEGAVELAQEESESDTLTVHSFFRGRKTRLLANLVVGTVDQLLMAALKRKHVMLRHLGLTGKVVIIDECHAYDAYMNTYLDCVLDWLGAYKIPVILLSATLPGKRRAELLRAYLGSKKAVGAELEHSQAYPLLCWTEGKRAHMREIPPEGARRKVKICRIEDDELVDELGTALEQGCVGIIVNTVKRAQTLCTLLQERYPEVEILLDHSRFLAPDRLEREEKIMQRVGKASALEERKRVLVIGTQVLEQSLDLDFDLLVTELCPMDLLLQRIGRLHRHNRPRPQGLTEPRCLVLGAQGEPDAGSVAVYKKYLLLRTRELLPESISLPEDISPLVQKTYDPELYSPEPSEEYEAARDEYELYGKKQKKNAKSYRLDKPSRDGYDDSIVGLLDDVPGLTEPAAQAAVRDGNAAIEVLVLRQTGGGFAELLSGAEKGKKYRMDTQPSADEARSIAVQRLRLPASFSKEYRVDEVIKKLESVTEGLPLWTQAPLLEGELFLLLGADGTAELADKKLRYDSQLGLMDEEEIHGTDRV